MAPQKPFARSTMPSDYAITGPQAKVTKKKRKARIVSQPGLRRKDGMLNAAIRAGSELMQIAKRNSLNSPLLRLPGEIRNIIWKYAVGYHHIDIRHRSHGRSQPIESSYEVHPRHINASLQRTFIRPTFQVHKVCRQMYVEASAMIYTLNIFGFNSYYTFDRWIKNRTLGQRRLVTSINVPFGYMRLYRGGIRKMFCQKFPNIKRISVDILVPYFSQHLEENSLEMAKQRIVDFIKDKEGKDVKIGWHGSTPGATLCS